MPNSRPITFAVAVNNREIFENNFMASPCFRGDHSHQILVQTGFSSASKAYNDAIERSTNDLIIFAHQDILFPESWIPDLRRALDSLEQTDPKWGVLGCYGEDFIRAAAATSTQAVWEFWGSRSISPRRSRLWTRLF